MCERAIPFTTDLPAVRQVTVQCQRFDSIVPEDAGAMKLEAQEERMARVCLAGTVSLIFMNVEI